ncbi:MAG: methyltransferase domain-containing protein [Thermodesulfovibrionales bacterium]|nr:methyltransferase domain-containing protein [Thermodesulfovibrionales bacterium]
MISRIKRFTEVKFPFLLVLIRDGVKAIKHQISKRGINRLLKEKSEIFIEVGAGDKKGENGWLTIDITKDCDIFWDLRKGIPFPDKSISKIYSSHFFEHLSFIEGQQFLDECKRVLIPDGTFSICVPNARLYIEAYVRAISLDENQFFGYKPAYNNTTKIDYVNYTAYMDGHHKYMFDEENLLYILKSKGFRNVRLRQFDPKLDLKARDFESIYAEAEKYERKGS